MSEKKISLLYILSPSGFVDFEKAGFLKRIFDRFNEMSNYYRDIHILSPDAYNYSKLLPRNCYHHCYPIFGHRKFSSKYNHFITYVGMFPLLSPFIHYNIFKNCDVYEARFIHGIIPAYIGKKIFNKPTVVWFPWWWAKQIYGKNTFLFLIASKVENILFNLVDKVFVSNKELHKVISSYIKNDKLIDFLPNFINIDIFYPKEYGINEKIIRIISIGTLKKRKNHLLLLKSVIEIKKQINLPTKVTIIGDGPLKDFLLKYAEKNSIDLEIISGISNSTVAKILNKHDYFIFTTNKEGNPKALLEAMASGLVCICTNVPGNNDIIIDGYNGFLCEKNPVSIANILRGVLNDVRLKNVIKRNARDCIVNNYSVQNIIKKESIYINKLLNGE